jgi:hypothetical protein
MASRKKRTKSNGEVCAILILPVFNFRNGKCNHDIKYRSSIRVKLYPWRDNVNSVTLVDRGVVLHPPGAFLQASIRALHRQIRLLQAPQ